MISNTSCSEFKLVDQAGLVPGEYQQKFQLNTSVSTNVNNNNNNNDISKNKYTSSTPITTHQLQSTKPFAFYTTNSVGTGSCIPTTECTTIIIQQDFSDDLEKNSNSPVGKPPPGQSSEYVHYEPCSYYNSKQENELTKKIFYNFRNESALNDVAVKGGGIGCGVVGPINDTDKATGDTRNNCSSSNNSNYSSKSSKSDRQQKTPMCRTEDQEHAFRQIEDVHNYSKLNRYGYCNDESSRAANVAIYSSNSSNQDEEDDDEEEDEGEEEEEEEFDVVDYEQHLDAKAKKLGTIGQQSVKIVKLFDASKTTEEQNKKQESSKSPDLAKTEDEGNITLPDHHARRPMNAFLIFCKRHRGIVKDKYKNFENRSITKILGEWWASLDTNDKKCYVNLAKQNKDAFFSANPNFKWYKLPAPSLRTLNTRPGNIERLSPGSGEYQCEIGDLPAQNNINYHTISPCDMFSRTETKKVSYFKLADETQMGELNTLMLSNTTPPTGTAPSKTDALQEALSETSDFFKSDCKRKLRTAQDESSNNKRSHSDNSFSSSEDDVIPKKSVRSCKGKKYQELINSGQITAVTSKKQVSPKSSKTLNTNDSSQFIVVDNDKCGKATHSPKEESLSPKIDAQSKRDERQWVMSADYRDSFSHNKHQFGFVSFDLEDKIRSLPAQCLETYLQRKKNTKRKKKINSKKRSVPQQSKIDGGVLKQTSQSLLCQPKTALEAREQMVGSQKRKARKESITRRDINSIQNDVQVLLGSSPVASVFVAERGSPKPQTLISDNYNATSDLLILAEVAANRTEIAQ